MERRKLLEIFFILSQFLYVCVALAASTTTPPRVYVPRTQPSGVKNTATPPPTGASQTPGASGSITQGPKGPIYRNDRDRNDRDRSLLLGFPQLLIRFRNPRVKSELKIQLESQQEQFKTESQQSRESSGSYRGGGGERGGYSRGGGGSDSGDSSFDRFQPPPAFSELGGKKTGVKRKEGERKGSEGSRPKSDSSGSRGRSSVLDDDDEEVEVEVEAGGQGFDEDYYGDESNLGLSSISASTLFNLEAQGFSLEEIQMTLYGEYGVKVSVGAIRKRLKDDANEKKFKKKSGKTRRDRANVRNQRMAERRDEGVKLPEGSTIQVLKLAEVMEVGSGEVVRHLMMNMGIMASMTQNIDMSVAKSVVLAFGKKLFDAANEEEAAEDEDEEESAELLLDGVSYPRIARPPVVTIMGHVDHGKTTLLDTIRKTSVAQGEAGGITQGISAFKVTTSNDAVITFIDTPGHAAFREMRKRGANVTDIIVLVIAADDGVMEQTKECIAAAQTAGCPIVVAVNKVDKDGADVPTLLTKLTDYGVLVEDLGGDVQCAKVSAKKGLGIEDLLDKIMLQAEIMALREAVECPAAGTVIEGRMDRRLGAVATVLVQRGTLRPGDVVLAGSSWGKVRKLISDQGADLGEAGPSTPVQIVGMSQVPNAGDEFSTVDDESAARETAEARQRIARQASGSASVASIIAQASGMATGKMDTREILKVPVLLKGDVTGSVEALRQSLDALTAQDDEAICKVDIVYSGIGEVTSSDVAIAAAAKAKILAFNVGCGFVAAEDARGSNVEVGYYDVVYTLLDEIQAKVTSTLAPPPPGVLVGRALIKKVFRIGKLGKIAGCEVSEGVIKMESKVRVMRGKRNCIYTGTLSSLKVVKEQVTEVPNGSDCGISFDDFQNFEENDVIECFTSATDDEDSD